MEYNSIIYYLSIYMYVCVYIYICNIIYKQYYILHINYNTIPKGG